MEFEVVSRGQKWIILLASSYCAYKVYVAVSSLTKMVADTSETIGIVSKDLNHLFESNSGQIPNSLKQIFKIAKTEEISESLKNITDAITAGMMKGMIRGYNSMPKEEQAGFVSAASFFIHKLFSTAGTDFCSAVVASFAKNLIMGYLSVSGSKSECKKFIHGCIKVFVSTAVRVYLEHTRDVNAYNHLFIGFTNPTHHDKDKDKVKVKDMAVGTLAKTSHGQVLTTSGSTSNFSLVSPCSH